MSSHVISAPLRRFSISFASLLFCFSLLLAGLTGAAFAGDNEKGNTAYDKGDYVEAVKLYKKAAAKGDPAGQVNLGYMYQNALGTDKDLAEAAKWYGKAADQGYALGYANLGVMYENGYGVTASNEEAFRLYKKAADKGDANGQVNLGWMYENGKGTEQSYEEALRWYVKAAKQGNGRAQSNVGWLYEFGKGVKLDMKQALDWYAKAAKTGDPIGMNNLGLMYEYGKGTEIDLAEAAKWYKKSAEKGNASAQANIGWMYDAGRGVQQDYAEAAKWYKLSADQNNTSGLNNLGWLYENGKGVQQDYVEAARLYKAAADLGYAYSQNNYGWLLSNGSGVEKNDVEAAKFFRLAADQGNAEGMVNLGWALDNGRGVTVDYAEALSWFRKAAELKNGEAQSNMGSMYETGHGVAVDFAEALKWYRLAAEQNNTNGLLNLAAMYKNGNGVTQDYREAIAWYQKAADKGSDLAKDNIKELEGKVADLARGGTPETPAEPEQKVDTGTATDEPQVAVNQPAEEPSSGTTETPAQAPVVDAPQLKARVALVIGNSAYVNATPLPNPRNDADAMAKKLTELGFKVIAGTDVTKQELEVKVREFVKASRTADLAFFFYAGHGIQVGGKNYLIPIDAVLEEETALNFEVMAVDSVTAFMGGENKVGVIMLDACRNNPFTRSFKRSLSASRAASVDQGLAPIKAEGGGLLVAYATAPDDVASDGDGKNSPFTMALLKHLGTKNLEINTVLTRVKKEVADITKNDQRPWTNSDLTTEVYLAQ